MGNLKKESPGEKKLLLCLGGNTIVKDGIRLSAFLKILSSPQTVSTSMDVPRKGHFIDSAALPKEKANTQLPLLWKQLRRPGILRHLRLTPPPGFWLNIFSAYSDHILNYSLYPKQSSFLSFIFLNSICHFLIFTIFYYMYWSSSLLANM